MAAFPRFWLAKGTLSAALLPLAALYRGLIALRRWSYRRGWLASYRLPCPVIVVGNIFVGGTGKTPVVLYLVEQLRGLGLRPGIITRGYGGRRGGGPLWVAPDSDPAEAGDEAVLLARRALCPVVAAPDRVAAARHLLAQADCNVLISDDGLQHYRLRRDLELVVVDAERGLGNGRLLPAGPLREPAARLQEVDMVLANGEGSALTPYCFRLVPGDCVNLASGERRPLTAAAFAGPVHAVAGIGNPGRFFASLRAHGLSLIEHGFPDHHRYRAADLALPGDRPILMTEKDAVKCLAFASGREWYLPVTAVPAPAARQRLLHLLSELEAV